MKTLVENSMTLAQRKYRLLEFSVQVTLIELKDLDPEKVMVLST